MNPDELRAQADAQPVAWRCEVRGDGTDPKLGAVDWRHYATTTNESNARAFLSRCGDGIEGRAVPLYPHPAPAAPQAEPCIGNDSACPCQDGDACHYKDAADGTKAWPVPQAEPKREPLSDERIDTALQTEPVLITRLMIGSMTVGEFKAALRRVARTIERAHGIGGSDE